MNPDGSVGQPAGTSNIVVSDQAKKRAEAAKLYIENQYKDRSRALHDRKARSNVLEEQLERMCLSETEKEQYRVSLAAKESEISRRQRAPLSADNFEKLTIVGRGAFGEVRIVREKATGKIYAMKKLRKEETLRRNQVRGLQQPLDKGAGVCSVRLWSASVSIGVVWLRDTHALWHGARPSWMLAELQTLSRASSRELTAGVFERQAVSAELDD